MATRSGIWDPQLVLVRPQELFPTYDRMEMRNLVPTLPGLSRTSSATIAGLLLLASCVSSDRPPPPLPDAIGQTVGAWLDSEDKPLPRGQPFVMDVWQGLTHCGWGRLVFLVIAWPLGTEVPGGFMSDPHTRMFVRLSTTGDLPASYFATTFDGRATLPANARDTGYRRNGWHLWVVDAAIDRAVWLVHDETVERWPAAKEIIACA
jgi:hypothetical protein